MTNYLNRTAEWDRLKTTPFFQIEDAPGSISITNKLKIGHLVMRNWLRVVISSTLIFMGIMIQEDGITGLLVLMGMLGLLGLVVGIIGLVWRVHRDRAHKVVFTPDAVYLYGMSGRELGGLPRDSMQQIAVETTERKKQKIFYHNFISDMGWAQALPCVDPTEATLRNNLLMVAWRQPLELDEA